MNRKRYMMVFVVLFSVFVQAAGAAELIIGTMSEPSIDPHYLNLGSNIAYSKHIYGSLTRVDDKMHLSPDLAESWKSIDSNTWEFRLRKGVKFHDGSEFTAEDVVFSYNRVPTINKGAFLTSLRGVVETRISDPYTLIIRTDKPNPILPFMLNLISVISKKAGEKSDTADFTSGKAAIGTGAYKFVEYVPGERLVLQKNENYYGEKPAFDKVTFRIFRNSETRTAALLGGAVDMIDFVPPSETEQLEKKEFRIFRCASDRIIYLTFNTLKDKFPFITDKDGKPLDKNPIKDIRVRKAISKAIYRDAVMQQVMKGLVFPVTQLIPEGWDNYNPDLKAEKYDPDEAKKLLAEAGYPDGFGITIHCPNDRYVNDVKICDAAAQMLAKIGIKAKAETMPKSAYFPKLFPPQNEFALALAGWGYSTSGEPSSGLLAIVHSYDKAGGIGFSNSGYANPQIDALIEKAVAATEAEERGKLLREAMTAVISDYGVIPLHTQSVMVASRKGIVYTPRTDEQTLAMNARPE